MEHAIAASQLPRICRELFKWLDEHTPARGIAVTLTFDPKRNRAGINRQQAESAFRQFINIVNRKVFGNAASRFCKRLTVIPVLEGGGSTGKRYHYHALIEAPGSLDIATFIKVLQEAWNRLKVAGEENTWKVCRNSDWLRYMLKERDKDDLLDAVDFGNLWLNKITPVQKRGSSGGSSHNQGTAIPASLIAAALPDSLRAAPAADRL